MSEGPALHQRPGTSRSKLKLRPVKIFQGPLPRPPLNESPLHALCLAVYPMSRVSLVSNGEYGPSLCSECSWGSWTALLFCIFPVLELLQQENWGALWTECFVTLGHPVIMEGPPLETSEAILGRTQMRALPS